MRSLPLTGLALAAGLLAAPPGWVAAEAADPASPPAQSANPAITPPAGTTGNTPQIVVSEVKLDGGWRTSRLIGSAVYDDGNQKIGAVDDLIVSGQDRIAIAVVSVGGFLGLGSKLVAVPFSKLRYDPSSKDARVVLPGATKDSLNAMPGFTYAGS